ncbi:MAG: hypothetical protein Aurels2KO_57220 [Aureliella sp.]
MGGRDLGGVLGKSETPTSLVEGMQRRDEDAWQRFMACYGGNLKDWMGRLLGPYKHEDLEDLFHDFSVRVFLKWPEVEYDKNKSFRGWLVSTANFMWRDVVRSRKAGGKDFEQGVDWQRLEDRSVDEAQLEFDATRESILRKAEAYVAETVSELKFRSYECLVLQSRTVQETAELLGSSTSSVSRYKQEVFELVKAKARELAELD